ncbi:hypothetical protein C8R45DRAFT_1218634 [Mycena sanguinolenta]|nr:hypothetical protein C8R45DRAFT_1218634 [Mycena sanguinolenta]
MSSCFALSACQSDVPSANHNPAHSPREGFHFFSYPFAHFWSTGAKSILHGRLLHRTLATASLTPDAPAHAGEKFVNRCLDFTAHSLGLPPVPVTATAVELTGVPRHGPWKIRPFRLLESVERDGTGNGTGRDGYTAVQSWNNLSGCI